MVGRQKLAANEIQAVVNLVASAIPGLTAENITVVDTSGRLLFRKEGDEDSLLSASQLEYQMKIEKTLRLKVESMLEEVVGIDRASARVTADIDFSQENRTEENFDPEGQVVRSEQLLTEQDGGGAAGGGIPGVKGQLATFTEAGGEGETAAGVRRNNVVRNYEITRTTRTVQGAAGIIKRLSVAVMVDGTYDETIGEDGGTSKSYIPRSPEEIAWFAKMTKNAIGYDEERGDQVEVVSMPFHISTIVEPEPDRWEKWRNLLEKLAMPLVLLIVAGAFLLFIVKPFIRLLSEQRLIPAAAEGPVGEVPEGVEMTEEEDLSLKPIKMSDKERIYKLAQSDPERAADLVRRWLREDM
jgi:flagellar M-ring protein FliF